MEGRSGEGWGEGGGGGRPQRPRESERPRRSARFAAGQPRARTHVRVEAADERVAGARSREKVVVYVPVQESLAANGDVDRAEVEEVLAWRECVCSATGLRRVGVRAGVAVGKVGRGQQSGPWAGPVIAWGARAAARRDTAHAPDARACGLLSTHRRGWRRRRTREGSSRRRREGSQESGLRRASEARLEGRGGSAREKRQASICIGDLPWSWYRVLGTCG